MGIEKVRAATLQRIASRRPANEQPTLRRKARVFAFFSLYFQRYFCRHMNALRLARWGEPTIPQGVGPVVLYTTHPAWWDAAVYILLADKHFSRFANFAPIDAEMLKKYAFFGRVGAYGVDVGSPRGAADFLAASAEILSRDDSVIWVAAQGRFADVRARPLELRPGVARLAELAPHAVFVPLAIEYAFWDQRGAEAFVAYGESMCGEDLAAMRREERRLHLEGGLTMIAERLSADVISRDPERFVTLLSGEAGVGGVFDLFKRFVALLCGERYDPAHGKRCS